MSETVLDVSFFRDAVLGIILSEHKISREVYELRFDLFLRAAKFYFNKKAANQQLLEPFPTCFFDAVRKRRRNDALKQCISTIPELRTINENTSLPGLVWELLHWIMTNPLDITVVKESEISGYLTDELRGRTKLMDIPYPLSNVCNIFEINHPKEINSTRVFLKHKSKLGSFFAFHGSPTQNLHSIIHRGLRCSLNHRSKHGRGTYLTLQIETALAYASQYQLVNKNKNSEKRTGPTYCIAIVEVIRHPSVKEVDVNSGTYYVVASDDLMRLKHLIVNY